jgi:hypothetical protein
MATEIKKAGEADGYRTERSQLWLNWLAGAAVFLGTVLILFPEESLRLLQAIRNTLYSTYAPGTLPNLPEGSNATHTAAGMNYRLTGTAELALLRSVPDHYPVCSQPTHERSRLTGLG